MLIIKQRSDDAYANDEQEEEVIGRDFKAAGAPTSFEGTIEASN